MRSYWGGMGDIQKLSGLEEKACESVDLDKPDWKYVRTLPKDIQNKIREHWEESNPLPDPFACIKSLEANAKKTIKDHAKKWIVEDKSVKVQWKDDWKVHWTWSSKDKKEVLDGDELLDFVEIAFEEGYFPDPIDNHHEIDEMTDKDILMKKMNLTEKQAEYVMMMKEAQQHLRKLEQIRNDW